MQTNLQPQLVRPEGKSHIATRLAYNPGIWSASLCILAVIAVVAAYLLTSSRLIGIGFPLDDAWIHQTYARTLAQYGEWAFFPGQPSAGSTAPLWSMLLALGYLVKIPYFLWTFLLGSLCLLGLALVGEAFLLHLLPETKNRFPWAGLFLIGEWHLAWAAVSGMETLLTAAVFLLILWRIGRTHRRSWAVVGMLIGFSVWLRPDGITLLGPAVFVLLFGGEGWRSRFANLAWLLAGTAMLFVPYLLFNLFVQGSIWPNTFYAKQAEYAQVRLHIPLVQRLLAQFSLPLIGSGLFLLPGFFVSVWQAWRRKQWLVLGAVLWFFGYGLIYALRLPVVYQYGRYFMPAMPVYFVCGVAGTLYLAAKLRTMRWPWLFARVWILSLIGIWAGFFAIGANRYAQDVAIIETEMVASARWLASNTPTNAIIAAHDIGALGYFGQRRLLDLAGLVSPEVIPFIDDEARMRAWLSEQEVDYLVVFEDWYLLLPEGKQVVYQTNGIFSPQSGGSNMLVYRWLP
jgi:hypothetical protein